ncbi:hypothetical protein [Streptomyces xiamenensis]|uniref:hypothetical protein n=1 Tax=Streptomyces xiamenensis TaxID=408015 RepID=UPI00343A29E9
MSQQSLHEQERLRIIEYLKSAGWNMAEGAQILNRAALAHDNGQILIEVEQDHERRELLVSLTSPEGRGVIVYPVYGDALDATLGAIVGFQDRIAPHNFQEILKELIVACPEVYVQEGEDDDPRLLTLE